MPFGRMPRDGSRLLSGTSSHKHGSAPRRASSRQGYFDVWRCRAEGAGATDRRDQPTFAQERFAPAPRLPTVANLCAQDAVVAAVLVR